MTCACARPHARAATPARPLLTLRGTPVSNPATDAALRAFLRQTEPKHAEWTRLAWADMAKALTDGDVAAASVTGVLPFEAQDRLRDAYADLIETRYVPRWRAALTAGARLTPPNVRELLTPEVIAQWIDTRRPWLISALTDAQANAVDAILRYHLTVAPLDQRTLAAMLRPALGLTEQQARALLKRRDALVEAGATPENIRAQLGRLAVREQRLRAVRIARTELAGAMNGGVQITMERAEAAGAFTGRVVKVWRAQPGKPCPICAGLNGRSVDLRAAFDGPITLPPAHPTCRCVVLYEEVR
jgi:hypothetical protein